MQMADVRTTGPEWERACLSVTVRYFSELA